MRPNPDRAAPRGDPDAQVRRALQLMREGRTDLSPLADRGAWNEAPDGVQDVVIREVAHRLAERFEWVGTRRYECDCRTIIDLKKAMPRDNAFTGLLGAMGIKSAPLDLPMSHRLGVYRHRATGIEMVMVPGAKSAQCVIHGNDREGGDRLLGSLAGILDISGFGDRLRSAVCVCKDSIPPLLVARWPVTRCPAFFGDHDERGGAPMTGLSHGVAVSWCTQEGLRLPTAAEWEHFARAGTTTRFYWGDEMDGEHCWHRGNSARQVGSRTIGMMGAEITVPELTLGPHAPAEHDAAGKWNAFGLVDVWGNVAEWDSRGGAWGGNFNTDPREFHGGFVPDEAVNDGVRVVGFRPVCDIPGWAEVRA